MRAKIVKRHVEGMARGAEVLLLLIQGYSLHAEEREGGAALPVI